jgi:hypothetical protein
LFKDPASRKGFKTWNLLASSQSLPSVECSYRLPGSQSKTSDVNGLPYCCHYEPDGILHERCSPYRNTAQPSPRSLSPLSLTHIQLPCHRILQARHRARATAQPPRGPRITCPSSAPPSSESPSVCRRAGAPRVHLAPASRQASGWGAKAACPHGNECAGRVTGMPPRRARSSFVHDLVVFRAPTSLEGGLAVG